MNPLALIAGWKGYALTAAACLLVGFGGGYQLRSLQADHAALAGAKAETKQVAKVAVRTAAAAQITQDVGAKAAARIETVRTVTQTVIERIPVYVTPETDHRYPVPAGAVRLYNAAVAGEPPPALPDGAGGPADAPSGLAFSAFLAPVIDNVGTCRVYAEKLKGWQDWYAAQSKAWGAK